ncbi:MAG: hypothetical protein Q4A50_06490 [Bacteroidales bacterium]|nr:hypothetical protein [Bacteroidales bacterium]
MICFFNIQPLPPLPHPHVSNSLAATSPPLSSHNHPLPHSHVSKPHASTSLTLSSPNHSFPDPLPIPSPIVTSVTSTPATQLATTCSFLPYPADGWPASCTDSRCR